MKKGVLFLDIGSSSIKGVVLQPNPETESFDVLWYSSIESKGVKRGIVISPEETAIQVKRLVNKVQEELQIEPEIICNVSGGHLISQIGKGSVMVSRADNKVSIEDINRLHKSAERVTLPPNYEIIWTYPLEYKVDGQTTFQEPLDLKGSKLEAQFIVIAGFSPYLKNTRKVFLHHQLELGGVFPGALSSGLSVTQQKEQELGTLVVDIGANTTSFVIFVEGKPRALGVVPIGASHVTTDIALEFQIPVDKAEEIKLQYASQFLLQRAPQRIALKQGGGEIILEGRRLARVIEARLKEIVDLTYKEVKGKGTLKLPGGIILTGGGSRLEGIEKLFQKRFSLLVQKGENKGFNLLQKEPEFSCALGLGVLWWKLEEELEHTTREGFWQKLLEFLKDLIP